METIQIYQIHSEKAGQGLSKDTMANEGRYLVFSAKRFIIAAASCPLLKLKFQGLMFTEGFIREGFLQETRCFCLAHSRTKEIAFRIRQTTSILDETSVVNALFINESGSD